MGVTAAIVSAVVGVAGLAMSAYGSISSASAQRAAGENAEAVARAQAANARAVADQQAGMYLYNAKVAEANGRAAKESSDLQAIRQREKVRSLLATQRASYGHAGVDIGEGSPLLVAEDTAARGEFDALVIEHEGNMGLWRAGNEATRNRYSADVTRAGGNAAADGFVAAGATRKDMYGRAAGQTMLTGLGSTVLQAGSMWGKSALYPSGKITVPAPGSLDQYAMMED